MLKNIYAQLWVYSSSQSVESSEMGVKVDSRKQQMQMVRVEKQKFHAVSLRIGII